MGLTGWSGTDRLTGVPQTFARPLVFACWGYDNTSSAFRYAMFAGSDASADHSRALRLGAASRFISAAERTTSTVDAQTPATFPTEAWTFMAAEFDGPTLREAYYGTGNRGENTSNVSPDDPTILIIGTRNGGSDPWDGAGAIAEPQFWDLAGFSQQDREDWVAKLGAGENPIAVSAEVGQPWSGRLVWYRPLVDADDINADGVGSNDLTMEGTLTTFASHPPVDSLVVDRLTPELVETDEQDWIDVFASGGAISVPKPADLGTAFDEALFIGLHSQQRLRHSQMSTVPAGFTVGPESPRPSPDVQDQPHIVWYSLIPDGTETGPFVFQTDEVFESGSPRVQPIVMRWKNVDPSNPFGGGTATFDREISAAGEFTATAPAATAGDLDSVRLASAITRRIGDGWTFATELTGVFPLAIDDISPAGAGTEPVADLNQMGARDLGHDNHASGTSGYRWAAGNVFVLGSPDDGTPGTPDHEGTEAVSWESVKLVAAPDETHPNATDTVEVYRHTASMAGDPVANGTLIHTFGPGGGSVVHATGWSPDSEHFIQMRAVNASGSTLGPEFTRTTWREAAHVLTDNQTLVVPIAVQESGVTVEKKEFHGSNVNETSWSYDHPAAADMLMGWVSAHDINELATITDVKYNGVSIMDRADVSSLSSAGGRLCSAFFVSSGAPSGINTLAVETSGGAPGNWRWHVYSLSGPSLAVRAIAFDGADTLGAVSLPVASEVGDEIFDYLAWRNSAVNIASIGAGQTQELSDDTPTRQNSTSKDGAATSTTMQQTGDDTAPSNIAAYYAVAIQSSGGTGTAMKSARIDVGLAALSDEDLWHG